MTSCYQCKTALSFQGLVGMREECPKCRADVHVCMNCDFYDPNMYNECREPQAERVLQKDRNNRCEFFVLSSNSKDQVSEKDRLKQQAEALFKRKDS